MTLSTAANRAFAFVPALLSVSVFVLSAVCPDAAWAGTSTGGQEHFADLYAMLKAWSTGTLGKSIALMFLLVGLGVGVIRGSIMGAVGFDLVASGIAGLAFGIIVNSLLMGAIASYAAIWAYSRLKQKRHPGYGLHYLYWQFPFRTFKRTPPSSRRFFVG